MTISAMEAICALSPVPYAGLPGSPNHKPDTPTDERACVPPTAFPPPSFLSIFMIIETTALGQLSFYSVVNKNSPGGSPTPDEISVNHILSYGPGRLPALPSTSQAVAAKSILAGT